MKNPDQGKVMKGCGGLRKSRMVDPKRGKGKRGGLRVIYLHVPEVNWIFLVDICGKDQKEDLSNAEKQGLTALAEAYRAAAMASLHRDAKESS